MYKYSCIHTYLYIHI